MIHLFRFVEGVTVYTLTSANRSQSHASETYTPEAIGLESDIESKQESDRATVDIGITLNSVMAKRWIKPDLSATVTLTLFEIDGGTTSQIWSGSLTNAKVSTSKITLTFDDGVGEIRNGSASPVLQVTCPYVLYGYGCFLDKASFADAATVTAVSGLVLTVPAAASQADGWYSGGIIKAANGDLVMITKHVGDQLTLIRSVAVSVSDAVTIYRGCDRSKETCNTKFSNLNRYGGKPWIPTVNIFSGTPIA